MTLHTKFDFDFKRVAKSALIVYFLKKSMVKTSLSADRLYSVNRAMAKYFKEHFNIRKEFGVFRNGTEMKPIEASSLMRDEINTKYHLDANDKILIFIGRIVKYKGLEFIIDTIALLVKINPNFKMFIVGDGPDLE
jgi:glycosyltransferase involved in cell wall biosynthesis